MGNIVRRACLLILVTTLALGCSSDYSARDLPDTFAIVRVFFATDRNAISSVGQPKSVSFGSERASMSFGTCEVSVPRDHRMGELETPSILHLELRPDPSQHVVLRSTSTLSESQLLAAIAENARASKRKAALVYIHGYNVAFDDAIRRTAQIAYDLAFPGPAILYSWPSRATLGAYTVDEANVEWSAADLREFLDVFLTESGAEEVYILAHSMGSRAATRALVDLLLQHRSSSPARVTNLILAAPDIDAQVFARDIAPVLSSAKLPTTLYASAQDIALNASKSFHGYPRAGDAGPNLLVSDGVDTIDATQVDSSLIGHSYYASNRSLLTDIFYLINTRASPSARFGLVAHDTKSGRYWSFSP